MKAPSLSCSTKVYRAAFLALVPLALALVGCVETPPAAWQPPIGPNAVFDLAPQSAPSNRLIVTDLRLASDAVGVTHYHPWEEFLYVIEGVALVEMDGASTRTVMPGESFVIPAQPVHTPRAGPQGVRAIVVRVHREGDPVSVPVDR
jgi:quercetin dioxygenase-like cupin family protein